MCGGDGGARVQLTAQNLLSPPSGTRPRVTQHVPCGAAPHPHPHPRLRLCPGPLAPPAPLSLGKRPRRDLVQVASCSAHPSASGFSQPRALGARLHLLSRLRDAAFGRSRCAPPSVRLSVCAGHAGALLVKAGLRGRHIPPSLEGVPACHWPSGLGPAEPPAPSP